MSALALPARLRPKAQSPCIQQTNRNRPIRETGARQTVFSLSKAARNRQGRIAYSEPSQSNCHNRPQISNVEKRKAGCSPLSRQPSDARGKLRHSRVYPIKIARTTINFAQVALFCVFSTAIGDCRESFRVLRTSHVKPFLNRYNATPFT